MSSRDHQWITPFTITMIISHDSITTLPTTLKYFPQHCQISRAIFRFTAQLLGQRRQLTMEIFISHQRLIRIQQLR